MVDRMKLRYLLALLLMVPVPVFAQTVMADPTRPPAGVVAGETTDEQTGPVLQSVIVPKKGKPVAVIGGKQVAVGEMYGESRLIKLTEREAVLEGPAGVERLWLTPGIEKTNIRMKTEKKSTAVQPAQMGSKP